MSMIAWTKRYYPVSARRRMSELAAVQHSLRKWEGLRKKILAEYKIKKYDNKIISDGAVSLEINEETCALCKKFRSGDNCGDCPLYLVRGCVQCDYAMSREEEGPYEYWVTTGNPEPMIAWLELTLSAMKPKGFMRPRS